MKNSEWAVLGLAGLAVWMIVRGRPATARPNMSPTSRATEITAPGGGRYANGWRYFSDGTSIGPDGAYYLNGVLVWRP